MAPIAFCFVRRHFHGGFLGGEGGIIKTLSQRQTVGQTSRRTGGKRERVAAVLAVGFLVSPQLGIFIVEFIPFSEN